MKKFKKHEGETVKALKEFNAHLRNEVHELKYVISMLLERNQDLEKKLESEEKKSQDFFKDMIEAEMKCDSLNELVEKLQFENTALKPKSSIFTDLEKCRTKPTGGVSI